jgi:hypothetical protein
VIGVSLVIGQDVVNMVRAGDDHRLLRRGFTSQPRRSASAASCGSEVGCGQGSGRARSIP